MGDIRIQRGYTDIGATGGTTTLSTSVSSTSSAFAVNTNNRRMHGGRSDLNTANLEVDDMSGGLYLSNTSTVQFDRISTSLASNMRFAWEVWEYTGPTNGANEFIVRGTYQLTLTGESITQAVSNISNINDCVPYITGILSSSGADDADSATAIAWMSSTGTLNVKRGSASNNTVQVYVTVVEYTGSNWSIKHGRQEGSGTDSGTITLVDAADGTTSGGGDVSDWNNAFIVHQYKANALNGVDDAISDTSATIYPGSSTTSVDWLFHSDHVDSASSGSREEFMVHVLCHNFIKTSRYTDTQSHTGAATVTLDTIPDLTLASCEVTRSSSGAGTAYGRGWVNARITSTNQVELWVHRDGNTISTRVQILDLSSITIGISDQGDEQLDSGDTNEVISGHGFGSTQGTGKVELCSTSDYSGTKVTQSIDSWSDTSIQFDPVFTGLSEGALWVFVTNDNSDRSPGYVINYGEVPYPDFVKSLNPDIYHRFNNSYTDEQGVAAANSQTSLGTYGFHTTPLTRNNTYAWSVADNNSRIEMNDTVYTNSTARSKRVIGGWIQLDRVHLVPSGFYEEGGGVNNVYMVVGYGNTILANLADSGGAPDYKIQGFSDFKLSTNRPYHLMIKFYCSSSTGADDGRFYFYVDGVRVSKYAGLETIPNQIKDTTFSSHIGDWSYGKPDANLDTGGTDIAYPGGPNILMSDWATWSDYSQSGDISDTNIRKLFVNGAIPTDTIVSDTPTNMQGDIDALSGTSYTDKPMPIKIYKPSTSSDLSLEFDNITFDDRCSMQICWMGLGTLTITNKGTSEVDPSKCETPNGGSIQIVDYKNITISGMVDGSNVVILDHSDGSVLQNTASSTGAVTYQTLLNAIDVIVIIDGYKIVQKFNITTTGDTFVQIVQERDYSYNNPV